MICSYIPCHSHWRKYRYRTIWCWFQARATRGLWLLACGWSQCALPYCLLFLIPAWRQSGKMKLLWDPLSTIRYLMWTTLYIFVAVLQFYSQYATEAYNPCYFIFVAPCFTTSSRRGKTKFSSCGKQRHWTVFLLLEGILELRILASNYGWL